MARQTVTIPVHRIIPAPLTGIGWVSVQCWDEDKEAYVTVATRRSTDEALQVIRMREGE